MTLEYAENRIKEAIKLHGKNAAKVRQQIIAWTYEDHKLLQELTKPHLSGIVAYQIERVASGRSQKAKAKVKIEASPKKIAKASKEEAFGMELIRALADSGVTFGFEDSGSPSRQRGKASQSHVDALKMMASKSKKPKKS